MPGKTRLTGAWRTLEEALNSTKSHKVIRRHIQRASSLNGEVIVQKLRKHLENGKFAANAELTKELKGSSKPLVGRETGAQLRNSMTYKVYGKHQQNVFVGIQRTHGFYNIAYFIHEGGAINVTDAMRNMFKFLWLASQGRFPREKLTGSAAKLFAIKSTNWYPLKSSTTKIVLPARRYSEGIKTKAITYLVRKNWQSALKAAFHEINAKGGGK